MRMARGPPYIWGFIGTGENLAERVMTRLLQDAAELLRALAPSAKADAMRGMHLLPLARALRRHVL